MDRSLLIVVCSAVLFLFSILSWHQHMTLNESKNNQMLLSIAVCSAITFIASIALTQPNTPHRWMGYLVLVFTQLGVLSVSIARVHQISVDSHSESVLGSQSLQHVLNTWMIISSLVIIFVSASSAYELYTEQQTLSLMGDLKQPAMTHTQVSSVFGGLKQPITAQLRSTMGGLSTHQRVSSLLGGQKQSRLTHQRVSSLLGRTKRRQLSPELDPDEWNLLY